jgi:hypothetical protein
MKIATESYLSETPENIIERLYFATYSFRGFHTPVVEERLKKNSIILFFS